MTTEKPLTLRHYLANKSLGVRELEAVGELKGIRFALASETDSHEKNRFIDLLKLYLVFF